MTFEYGIAYVMCGLVVSSGDWVAFKSRIVLVMVLLNVFTHRPNLLCHEYCTYSGTF